MKPNVKTTKRLRVERKIIWLLCAALTLVSALLAADWICEVVRDTKSPDSVPSGKSRRSAEVRPGVTPSQGVGARHTQTPIKHTPAIVGATPLLPVTTTPPFAGSLAYFDTNTGWLGQAPPGTPTPSNSAFSTSTQGLQETPSPVQGGGILLDLKGRFQNAMTITIEAGGQFSSSCSSSTTVPGASDTVAPVKTASRP